MEGFPKGESLYFYKGATYGGGGGGSNNGGGNGGGCGGGGGGGGSGPRERLWKEPQEILFTERKGNPLRVPDIKGSINRGNRYTP